MSGQRMPTNAATRLAPPIGAGRVIVRPNPAPAGGEVEVEFQGTPPLYYRTAGTGGWVRVPIDPGSRRGKIRVPRGFRVMMFTDDGEPPLSAEVRIVDPN